MQAIRVAEDASRLILDKGEVVLGIELDGTLHDHIKIFCVVSLPEDWVIFLVLHSLGLLYDGPDKVVICAFSQCIDLINKGAKLGVHDFFF